MVSKNKIIIATLLVFSFFAVFLVVALTQSPPTKVEEREREEESDQGSTFEADLDTIDQSTAETFTFIIEGMNSREVAEKIVNDLHSSFEGCVGNVKIDIET